MFSFLDGLILSEQYIPHGHCYLWKPELLWLHILSDAFIALAYYSIPLALIYFVRQRQDIPFKGILILFSLFIFSCGTTHIMSIWTVWHSDYWLSGLIKAITAIISLITAFEMIPTLPKALALRSPRELAIANQALELEIANRQQAEIALQQLNLELESRVEQRTKENKGIEETLRKTNQELLASNKELEKFAYLASHDLREPLRMVTSFTQLLAQRYSGKLDDDADQIIGFAVDGAKRMEELIHDLLEYSQVGKAEQSWSLVDCELIVNRALNNLQVSIQESEVKIKRTPLPTISGDPGQLIRLWQNLLDNAIIYCHPEYGSIEIGAEVQTEQWLFWVKDNGIGIAPQYQERIFQIFQRLHTREKYPGTGIGLAICHKIIEKHGGRIWVESSAGEGATFYFTLPQEQDTSQTSNASEK